ncbi:MAG: hypothetical protein V9G12_19330 [Microthrixaceae bacterium]
MVEIGEGSFYPAHGHWAQPDLGHATELLRQVRDDAALRDQLSTGGPLALRPFTAQAGRRDDRRTPRRCGGDRS